VSDKKVGCKWSQPIHGKCAVVFNVQCKRNQCVIEIHPVWPMWSRDLTPPPRAPALIPYLPGNRSLLVTLNKDGSGQCSGHPRTAHSTFCGPWRVYVNIVLYFSPSDTVFGTHPRMVICIALIIVIFFGFD
jgi:hypothetical protein